MSVSPEPGDIGLTTVRGTVGMDIGAGQMLFDRLMKTRVPDSLAWQYRHAFGLVDDGMIVEAEPGGARHVPLHYDNVLWLHLSTLTDLERQLICAAALKYVGVPYSFLDYAALAAHGLHIPSPGLRPFIASTGHMICSQLVDRAYMDAGIQLFADHRWPGDVIPAELAYLAWQLQPKG